jgi:hypothetical protein
MPFNGSGVFARIYNWVTDAGNGVPITASRMDADTADIAAALNNCVTRDGLGYFGADINANGFKLKNLAAILGPGATLAMTLDSAGNVTHTGASNFAPPLTLASAATVAIGAAASNNILVTGTAPITAFDSIAAGVIRYVTFAGALTLTHNATSLILPGAANITTAANDTATMLSLGGRNWQCIAYQRSNGTSVVTGGAWQLYGGSLATAQRLASNSASLDWTGLSGFSRYAIVLESLLAASGGATLRLIFGTGSTPTWITSGYTFQCATSSLSTNSASGNSGSSVCVVLSGISSGVPTSGAGTSGIVFAMAMQSSNPEVISDLISPAPTREMSGGQVSAGATPTAIRLQLSGGNIVSGTATLYGIL